MTLDAPRLARWLAALHSTAPADRSTAEDAARRLYGAAALPPPRVCWFDSPRAASWAVALLVERYSPAWPPLLAHARTSREARAELDAAAAALCDAARVGTLEEVLALARAPLSPLLGASASGAAFHQARVSARMKIHGGAGALFAVPASSDVLATAASALFGGNDRGVLTSGLFAPMTGTLIGYSALNDYSWSAMARDEEVAGDVAPEILEACWTLALTAGPSWPFQGLIILTDHPAELHLDASGLPHRDDGAAVVYRDGWSVFAWRGKAIPADWILRPETISPGDLRHADAEFRKMVQSRVGTARPSKAAKPSALVTSNLSLEPDQRIAQLRTHAGGRLPLFDRYVAGEHAAVWRELANQGPGVRADPLAADALAVAAETMRRAAANVNTLVARLKAMGYVFTSGAFHVDAAHRPPSRTVQKQIAKIEKTTGPLPLALKAFYEFVGGVCLVGRHRSLAPDGGRVAPDPLWVYGADDALASLGTGEEGEIVIAPDDLHKAGESGGDPYTIALPNPGADAPVSGTPYRVTFVDYLRLSFQYGGFPGYSTVDREIPAEIAELSSHLLPL